MKYNRTRRNRWKRWISTILLGVSLPVVSALAAAGGNGNGNNGNGKGNSGTPPGRMGAPMPEPGTWLAISTLSAAGVAWAMKRRKQTEV